MTETTPSFGPEKNIPALLNHRDERGVRTIVLNRPGEIVTLNLASVDALTAALQEAYDDPETRVVVLRSNGKTFCAGVDLKELAAKIEDALLTGNKDDFKAYTRKYFNLFSLMEKFKEKKKPTIGVLEGDTLGFGFTLALLCHKTLSSGEISIGYPERDLGFKPLMSAYFAIRSRFGLINAMDFIRSSKKEKGYISLKVGAVAASVNPDWLEEELEMHISQALKDPERFLNKVPAREKPGVNSPILAPTDDYDRMINSLLAIAKLDSEEGKKELVDRFTDEMCRPIVIEKIKKFFADLEAKKAQAAAPPQEELRDVTLTPKEPPSRPDTKHYRRATDHDDSGMSQRKSILYPYVRPPIEKKEIDPESIRLQERAREEEEKRRG
jgi:enoyl-CoA hydratase/carnithine racemase